MLKHLREFRDEIREQDPLKQGLKLIHSPSRLHTDQYSRARSTKTRIETKIHDMTYLTTY